MYKVFRLTVSDDVVHPLFLYKLLKSDVFLQRYRAGGKGSVKRRKSVAFGKFADVYITVPPAELQRELVEHLMKTKQLEAAIRESDAKAQKALTQILQVAGLA